MEHTALAFFSDGAAEGDFAEDVGGEGVDDFAEIDGAGEGVIRDVREHDGELRVAVGAERVDALGAEEVEDAKLARLAPVRAVGGEGDAFGVVDELARDFEIGTAGEGYVVGFDHGADGGGGGEDESGDLAEFEKHDRTVNEGEGVESTVRDGEKKVEVANERERWW